MSQSSSGWRRRERTGGFRECRRAWAGRWGRRTRVDSLGISPDGGADVEDDGGVFRLGGGDIW